MHWAPESQKFQPNNTEVDPLIRGWAVRYVIVGIASHETGVAALVRIPGTSTQDVQSYNAQIISIIQSHSF
jgi:hypothetical protein